MIYHIWHWYCGTEFQAHKDAFQHLFETPNGQKEHWAIEISDIQQFVEDYGYPIMICPSTKAFPHPQIIVADSWRFGQK